MTGRDDTISRRCLLGGAGASACVLALNETSLSAAAEPMSAESADVVIVGSGAAGLSAAIAAKLAGASVLVLEKGPAVGGTTAKSDGAYWIPNNHLMRAEGLTDPKSSALAYMAKTAYPFNYRAAAPELGLSENAFELIETFYDRGAEIIESFIRRGVLKAMMVRLPDYVDHAPENCAPLGRLLMPVDEAGKMGKGHELVRQLRSWLVDQGVPILMRTRVDGLVRDPDGTVIGVSVIGPQGQRSIYARRGVVFGSGGFTHNREMMLAFQPAPIFGGCAVPTNQGDFVRIAAAAGAKLGNMVNGWRAQLVVETALEVPSVARDIWQPPGDSMILVNRYGRRVVDEKRNYHERTRVHFIWDPLESEFPNLLLFMIYDRRTAELFAGNYPLPAAGEAAAYVIEGANLPELAKRLSDRLRSLEPRIGAIALSTDFARNLAGQIQRYNSDAKQGVDGEFQRGRYPYDDAWHTAVNSVPIDGTTWPKSTGAHPSLHPLDTTGPFYAIILGAGMLDTNGGPVIDSKARVLDFADRPIAGLYGAGNCIASPAGAAYWGAGGTIGPAIVFGTIAGRQATASPARKT